VRRVAPLTDTLIRKSKIKEKDYTLADGNGLHLLIQNNGIKKWEFVYTSPTTGKRRKTSFGNYLNTTLQVARQKRADFIDKISKGIDPIDFKRTLKEDIEINSNGMFINIMEEWLLKEKKDIVESTFKFKDRCLRNDVLPNVKRKHIRDIKIHDIVKIIEKKEMNAPEIASRLFNLMDNLFKYAVLKGYCERNILSDIRKSDIIKPRKVIHYEKITNIDILEELVKSIYSYNGNYSIKNALKLVLHLPLRPDNLCLLRWQYIDFENKTLVIPRQLMKVKDANLDAFILPLTDEVIEILNEQMLINQSFNATKDWIFVGKSASGHINKESPNRALKLMGFNDKTTGRYITLHGFRGTMRSLTETMNEDGRFSYEVLERVLDHHEKNMVARAYNNKSDYFKHFIPLLNFWTNFIILLRDK